MLHKERAYITIVSYKLFEQMFSPYLTSTISSRDLFQRQLQSEMDYLLRHIPTGTFAQYCIVETKEIEFRILSDYLEWFE